MNALLGLYEELEAILGYEVQMSAALHQWNAFLKKLSKSKGRHRGSKRKLYFGSGDPNDSNASYRTVKTFSQLISASGKNGVNSVITRRSVVVLVHSLWEDQYRQKIAEECGLSDKNDIRSDVFHDLNKYRQAILHAGGHLDREPTVIRFFERGEQVSLTDDHMRMLFLFLVEELNRIGKIYYKSDPALAIDKPLN